MGLEWRREQERFDVVVIGGGQAGLSAGYHLARRGLSFVILDAHAQVGDVWRNRWDSLRLFSPAPFNGLDGMPFPARAGTFPSKDQMADYLAAYARRFALPVRSGVTVDRVWRDKDIYRVKAGDTVYEAGHVVVAMANYQRPVLPDFAPALDPGILQIYSGDYRNPAQLKDGPVLVVGAGNSGAEIALELSKTRATWLAGRDVGEIPFRFGNVLGRHLLARIVLRLVFHHLLTVGTPPGRKARAKAHGAVPLIRTGRRELAAAGVRRTAPVKEIKDGRPLLADGTAVEVANVIWCTGFRADFSWIDLPVFARDGTPRHLRGVADLEPGLYFLGLNFLYAMSSTMVHGVGRDAAHVADVIARRVAETGVSQALGQGSMT